MLQVVRKYTQGWVATVLGIILSFAFVMWGIENYVSGSSKKHLVAKVNGKEITSAEVENDFQRNLMRIKDQVGANVSLPPSLQQQLKAQALNNLIIQNILTQAAYNAGFRVTSQEASALIKQMPAFQEEGRFSKERFYLIMNKMAYTQQEFFNEVSKTLVLNQVASGLGGTEFVLPGELNQAVTLLEQKRDIEYAIIPASSFKKEVKISSEQINRYYDEHKQFYKIPAQVQIEYVLLSSEGLKQSLQVSEKEISDYFDANGDLDKNNPKAVDKAKEAVKQQKLEQAFLAASDKLTDLAYTNPNSLKTVADELGLEIMTSGFFTQNGGELDVTKNPKVLAAAFNPDLQKNHANSGLIEIAPGKVAVIRIKDYHSENFAPLTTVQDKIKIHLTDAAASVQAQQKALSVLQKLSTGNDFKKLMVAEHLKPIIKNQVSRHEKTINPEILRVAFNIPPKAVKPISQAQLANGDWVVIFVKNSVNLPLEKITENQRKMIAKLYPELYGKTVNNLYIDNQIHSAKVKTYQK